MSQPDAPPRRTAPTTLLGLAAATVAVVAAAAFWQSRPAGRTPLPAPGLAAPVDADGLRGQGYGVTIAILNAVYGAFAETDEAAIYDGLATVAAGDALEALYLERAGALATGGLPDQVVHELDLIDGTWRMADGAMTADIRWAVLAQVGHDEHTHMRGNAYGAELTIAPAAGAWRMTDFRLTDVDRTEAGTLTTPPDGDGAVPAAPPG
ncbi:hypothetical protein [Jannaschia sp. LMIT008]|uniref:hypothetical protein n=1 Tax=Jannaschia maritima TaxID=3032585 RepID=UPI00281139C4|nr:hypothetical protein [Jannaschia sp. LMIT008]